MPINRAPFNLLVDDDGSNTVGSIWNKAQIAGVILDPTDRLTETLIGTTVTGTVNDWNLGWIGHTFVQWYGTAPITVTGFAGGVKGQRLTFLNASTSLALFPHYAGGSVAANRMLNAATSAPTPVAPGGWAAWEYDGANWFLCAHEQGAWITPVYSAAGFSGNANNWTVEAGDVATLRFRLQGRTLTVAFTLKTTSPAVGSGALLIFNTMWGGFTAASEIRVPVAQAFSGGANVAAQIQIGNPALTYLSIAKNDGTVWATETNLMSVYGQIIFDVT